MTLLDPHAGGDPRRRPRVLVADDRPDVVEALHRLLTREGFAVRTVRSSAVLDAVAADEHDVVLLEVAEHDALLRRARRLEAEGMRHREAHAPQLVAHAPSMAPVRAVVERAATSDAHVLVTGEPGTGKEVIARTVHARSARAAKPFVDVDARALSIGAFERELFGHAGGAFTDGEAERIGAFELADGGTLFVRAIEGLPLAHQATLVRALERGEFRPIGAPRTRRADVRVIATTIVDLGREVAEGRFRADLLGRLRGIEIPMPPLRDRREDVPLLAAVFLERLAAKHRRAITSLAPDAERALVTHGWPGNVRELEHVIERSLLTARGDVVTEGDLGLPTATLTLEQIELRAIRDALRRAGGNVADAAAALGLSRSAMYRRLQHHGIRGAR